MSHAEFPVEWQPIATAPRGRYVERPGPRGPREVFSKDVVWTFNSLTRHLTTSYWIEEESRWNGYTPKDGPDLWCPYYPKPPEGEGAEFI